MFCTNCGKEVINNAKFCSFCGKPTSGNETIKPAGASTKTIKAVFHRLERFTGSAVSVKIYIDKQLVGSIGNNQTIEVDVPCGKHKVITEMWSGICEKEIDFSEEYSKVLIDIYIRIGLITNKPDIVSVKYEK